MSETWENDQNLSSQWKKKRKKSFSSLSLDQIKYAHTLTMPQRKGWEGKRKTFDFSS